MKAYRTWNGQVHYAQDIKPSLLKRGAKGDWGYTEDHTKATSLTLNFAAAFLRDHPDGRLCGDSNKADEKLGTMRTIKGGENENIR